MNKRIAGIVAVVVLVLLVAASLAIPADDDDPAGPDDVETTTTTLPFDPEPGVLYAYRTLYVPDVAVEVAVGDTLEFENRDEVDHTFTSDEDLFDSGPIGPGDTYGYSYTEAGTYAVHCEIHPTMQSEVIVTES